MFEMMQIRNIYKCLIVRRLNTKTKAPVELDKMIQFNIEHGLNPKKHPGINQSKNTSIPEQISKAIIKSTKDYPIKSIRSDGEKLHRYLKSRHPPMEEKLFYQKRREVQDSLEEEHSKKFGLNDEKQELYKKQIAEKTNKRLGEIIYNWKPIDYDQYTSFQYLVKRGPIEYAVLIKIMLEIFQRDFNFKPRSYLDFGSGVGTGIWAAANFWKNSIYEYFMIDASRDMNDLAELILRNGEDNKEISLKNVYFRQFLPSKGPKFNIVVSAFSLLELGNQKKRLEVLLNLWNKCDKYMVVVENGTNVGYNLIMETRNFILKHASESKEHCEIFSPCTHSLECPREKLNDGTPCNFEVTYLPISFDGTEKHKKEEYSYIVFKKSLSSEATEKWPRLVRPTLVRARHTVCRMCANDGNLKEVIFTASKHGRLAYRCARSTKWGDRLPIEFVDSK